MPVAVAVSAREVVVDVSGWAAVWSLSRGFAVPRAAVRWARVLPRRDVGRPPWLRWPGTAAPGIVAGTYKGQGRNEFWYVRRADRVLVLTLAPGAPYTRVVLEVPDPDAVAAALS